MKINIIRHQNKCSWFVIFILSTNLESLTQFPIHLLSKSDPICLSLVPLVFALHTSLFAACWSLLFIRIWGNVHLNLPIEVVRSSFCFSQCDIALFNWYSVFRNLWIEEETDMLNELWDISIQNPPRTRHFTNATAKQFSHLDIFWTV